MVFKTKLLPTTIALGLAVGIIALTVRTQAQTTTPTTNNADATTLKIVAAAQAFENTLDATQKAKVNFAFDDKTQRAKWSNFPTGIFQRNGLRMGDLSASQQQAVLTLLASVLSPQGYKQILEVMDGDEVLKNSGGGGNLIFGKAEYYVSILGTPSSTTPWMLQFGGHHMALNATIFGKDIALTPSLTGGQPTSYTLNGTTVQPIIGEVTKAFAFINALDASQQKTAILGSSFIDLVLGPGQDGKTLQNEGISAASLNVTQQNLLLELINERVGIENQDDAAVKMTEVKANLAKTYFAWSGPTTSGSAAYFRVTGPTILIEYSPQSMGGNATNHVHSMLRDPTNDYGAAWLKAK
jgi:hypothetical protein